MRRWYFSFFQVDSDKITQNFHKFRHKKKNCQERVDTPVIPLEKSGKRNKKLALQIFYCVPLENIMLKSGFRALSDVTVKNILLNSAVCRDVVPIFLYLFS
jgi:hypothetical protein